MLTQQAAPLLGEAEYLEMEKQANCRHEFVDGYIYAMTGGSRSHNKISGNLYLALRQHLKDTACEVYMSDIKLKIAHKRSYYYPDLLLTCSHEEVDDYVVTQPCLIIEVLSPTTALVDTREKLIAYQSLSSLREYCLVAQRKYQVQRYHRLDDAGLWHLTVYGKNDLVTFACVDLQVGMDEIYAGVLL